MNRDIPASGRPAESLEQMFGSVFDLAGRFAAQIGQDDIEARLRQALRAAQHPAAEPQAAPSPAADPPSSLVSRAADGESEAWNQLVERYAPLVWSICTRYRLDRLDIDDVSQVVWLLLIENMGRIREPAALPGWLATTTQRECLRVLRTARRHDHAEQSPPDEAQADLAGPAIELAILNAERGAELQAAFADLPRPCQELLSMLLSDPPHSYAEISAALGIAIGSIGAKRARCLDRLRRAITPAPAAPSPAPTSDDRADRARG